MSLSRSKIRTIFDCADCSNTDAEWASVNRGVIVCDDCCLVHRNMGREVSQIKSIKKSQWSPSELQMVVDLYTSGSNSIWEYNLLNSGSNSLTSSLTHSMRSSFRKKPNPKDGLYPVKNDFIKAKYQKLVFVKKPGPKDGTDVDSDVSEELHSSVRSSSLKTSLRLLIAGADPNYLHPAKHNTPLHVAAKSGQLAQVELLFAYGADPLITDLNGKTALDYAKGASHNDIVERLIEFQFELTDRLSHFLCGRKPDHRQGQHYLIPQLTDSIDPPEDLRLAKNKLQTLTNKQFEELAKDVYDEVDRRELDEIWLQLRNQSIANPEHNLVPFLPVNPMFSSTRNQGRQKLARFSAKNFTSLLIDVLLESKRRQLHSPKGTDGSSSQKLRITNSRIECCLSTSDEDTDPLYDSVASDDERDYDEVEDTPTSKSTHKMDLSKNYSSANSELYQTLREQLFKSDSILKELMASNKFMTNEISTLKTIVNSLVDENAQLRSLVEAKNQTSSEASLTNSPDPTFLHHHVPHVNQYHSVVPQSPSHHHHHSPLHQSPVLVPRSPNKIPINRPSSMYDKPPIAPDKPQLRLTPPPPPPPPSTSSTSLSSHRITQNFDESESVVPRPVSRSSVQSANSSTKMDRESFPSQSETEYGALSPKHNSKNLSGPASTEDVFRRTEQITKGIQELLKVSQEGRQEIFVKCAENIQEAVFGLLTLFPERPSNSTLQSKEEHFYQIIDALRNNTVRLMTECHARNSKLEDASEIEKVIDCAYDIARAARQLIMVLSDTNEKK